ncbi:hypothetical protein [Sphingobacterium corticibacter]|uniref:Uncharacterized protein n=1 Tax=Sphingobacterium corticibacter TaxID=2171749 RepID=A0A2T8HFF7_9SPHI|nr:hypothetical protein [Sphingobacterium corticibacter]PVH24171.1 hypothetical protein DC487_15665 [Sphingobacterium corticibacter]
MKDNHLIEELGNIRKLMEKSSKFVSISGLSGVLVGIYALIGAAYGYITVYGFKSQFGYRDFYVTDEAVIVKLVIAAIVVLFAALLTGYVMAQRKAKINKQSIWNITSKNLLFAVAVPLLAGGIVSIVLINRGAYSMIASMLLIFYGLALTSGSVYTFKEVRYLGILEVILGIFALAIPGYGVWFWTIGFGVLHIIYGLIVHYKYEK